MEDKQQARSVVVADTIAQRPQESSDAKLVLRLQPKRGVRWDEQVVDNEGMNKKSSKRTCSNMCFKP